MNQETLKQFLTEDGLLKKLGLDKETLDYLRQRKNFPCHRLGPRNRLYFEPDIVEWLKANKNISDEK